jgi:Mor family transcriptional regulator
MNNTLNLRKEKKHQSLIIFSLSLFMLFTISCDQKPQPSEKSESKLIDKVNAVQQQIMVQGNMSEEEELALSSLCSLISPRDGFDNKYITDGAILFKDVKKAPIYDGCEGLSEEETKKCFNESIVKYIKEEFNSSIVNALNISEPQEVAAFFIIDKNGNLTGMKIRDAEVTIQGEIGRVLKNLPKMKPASQDGINVPVLCSMLVTYGSEIEIELVYILETPEGIVD